jgi:putative membrane protein
MIPRFSDHAANERTFLAWVRTGIATIAFGFVIDKFNLFLTTLASADFPAGKSIKVQHSALGRYDGTALIFLGITLIAMAAWRFVRTSRLIESDDIHQAASIRVELVLSLVLIAAALGAYVALY